MLCHSGEALSRQLDKTLSLMSQFAYVHNDNILLGLAIARKPAVSILSVAGTIVLSSNIDKLGHVSPLSTFGIHTKIVTYNL